MQSSCCRAANHTQGLSHHFIHLVIVFEANQALHFTMQCKDADMRDLHATESLKLNLACNHISAHRLISRSCSSLAMTQLCIQPCSHAAPQAHLIVPAPQDHPSNHAHHEQGAHVCQLGQGLKAGQQRNNGCTTYMSSDTDSIAFVPASVACREKLSRCDNDIICHTRRMCMGQRSQAEAQ